jgi:hypothetical protein
VIAPELLLNAEGACVSDGLRSVRRRLSSVRADSKRMARWRGSRGESFLLGSNVPIAPGLLGSNVPIAPAGEPEGSPSYWGPYVGAGFGLTTGPGESFFFTPGSALPTAGPGESFLLGVQRLARFEAAALRRSNGLREGPPGSDVRRCARWYVFGTSCPSVSPQTRTRPPAGADRCQVQHQSRR